MAKLRTHSPAIVWSCVSWIFVRAFSAVLMGNYAGTAALLTVFDMQFDPDQPLLLPQL